MVKWKVNMDCCIYSRVLFYQLVFFVKEGSIYLDSRNEVAMSITDIETRLTANSIAGPRGNYEVATTIVQPLGRLVMTKMVFVDGYVIAADINKFQAAFAAVYLNSS